MSFDYDKLTKADVANVLAECEHLGLPRPLTWAYPGGMAPTSLPTRLEWQAREAYVRGCLTARKARLLAAHFFRHYPLAAGGPSLGRYCEDAPFGAARFRQALELVLTSAAYANRVVTQRELRKRREEVEYAARLATLPSGTTAEGRRARWLLSSVETMALVVSSINAKSAACTGFGYMGALTERYWSERLGTAIPGFCDHRVLLGEPTIAYWTGSCMGHAMLRCLAGIDHFKSGVPPFPFRPPAHVLGLATAIDGAIGDSRPEVLVLADALEEAGGGGEVTDAAVGHLRWGGRHWRGCWVVDRLLGRGR